MMLEGPCAAPQDKIALILFLGNCIDLVFVVVTMIHWNLLELSTSPGSPLDTERVGACSDFVLWTSSVDARSETLQ